MAGPVNVVAERGASGSITIRTYGLRELSKAFTASRNKLAAREFAKGMKAAAKPIADLAKKYADGLGGVGDFASTIRITGGRAGVFLDSTDPGAKTIEFAGEGMWGPAPGSKTGLWGAPAGSPPRALYPGIDAGLDDVADNITKLIDDILARYLNAEFSSPDGA